MLKRIFALILTLILTVVSIPIQAIATEIGEWIPSPELPTSSGEVGLIEPMEIEVVDNLNSGEDNHDPALDYADLTPDSTGITGECTWALYGTELVISGNGKMADYNDTDNRAPWGTSITKVTIGSGVTNIGNSAFGSCKSLTSVTIPETVKTIGSFAFENASALTSVSLPEGVEEIGLQAFRNCTKLSSVSLPESLALVGEEAFLGCNLSYTRYNSGNFYGKYLGNPSNPYVLLYSVAPNNNNYSYKLTSFTVHPNTRVIGPTAFYNKTDLTTVTLSASLQGISDYAFYGCTALTNLTLPESVSHIGAGAFYNCVGITDANTDSLKYIGNGAFGGCLGITSVDFSDKLEYIGAQAFYGCSNLGSLTLSDNLNYLGENAFYGCKSSIYYTYSNATYISSTNNKYHTLVKVNSQALTSFSIPSSTKIILENAFNGCNKLTSLTLPSSLKYIGYGAFNGCSGLASLDVPASVTYIGNAAFSGCSSLQSLSLPYVDILHQLFGKTSGEGLYTAAYNTTAYYIPTSLKTISVKGGNIKAQAFENFTSLTSITLSNTLEIGKYAFRNCSSIKTMTIPKSVQVMGEGIFSGCSSLEELTIPFVGNSRKNVSDTKLFPLGYMFGTSSYTGSYEAEQYASTSSKFIFYIPLSLTKVIVTDGDAIFYGAFYNCSSLKTLILEEGITEIADYAFYSCTSLTEISIPEGVEYIGENAFIWCSALSNVTLPESVEIIGSHAFYACTSLTNFSIPAGVVYIGDLAFAQCSVLPEILIPDGVEHIGYGVFHECNALTSISIPDSIQYIGDSAFDYCPSLSYNTDGIANYLGNDTHPYLVLVSTVSKDITSFDFYPQTKIMSSFSFESCESLTSIKIPEGFTRIPSYAFDGCSKLSYVYIPESVEEISRQAFAYSGLTEIQLPSNLKVIDDYAFAYSGLTEIQLPSNLEVIDDYAFAGCSALTSIVIPDTITIIPGYAFYDCTKLSDVIIPEGVKTIGDGVFKNCTSLKSVVIPDSVESIGAEVFADCTSLESITIPFVGDKRKTSSDTYQYPLGWIFGVRSKAGLVSTRQYYHGSRTTSTTSSTYYIPSSLKTVAVTDGDLNYGAFYNCNNIEKIIIGEGVNNITPDAFIGTTLLEGFEVSKRNPNYSDSYRILYNKDKTEIIWTPDNHTFKLVINYTYANGETAFDTINKGLKAGDAYSVEIPEILGYTPNYTEISGTMPAYDLTIDVIYYEHELIARGDCNSDISWTLYADGTLVLRGSGEMPDYTSGTAPWAAYADKVQTVYIDSSITNIGAYSFENCVNLTFIDYGYGIKTIGAYALSGCSSLDSFKLPSTVSVIAEGAFANCSGLETVIIPDSIKTISDKAFYNCGSLVKLTVGGAVTTIGNDAFANCANLTQIYFRGEPATMGTNAFGSTSGKYVYYYSTISGWESVISESKYYGYLAFPYNAISNEKFNGTNVFIIKVVDKYNTPLVGAVVKLGDETQTTMKGGMAYFVKPEIATKLEITYSDHEQYIDSEYMPNDLSIMDIVVMTDLPSHVQGVRVNGKSVATSVVTINSGESSVVSITVSGYSKYTITKYELYQGNRLINTNWTDASETTFKVSSTSFEEGQTVVVRMHTSDGGMVASGLNIDVVKLAKIDEKQVVAELSDVKLNVDLDAFGKLVFNLPFKVNNEKFTYYTEGRTIHVGINVDVTKLKSDKFSKARIEKEVENSIKKKDSSLEDEVSVEIGGYIEIEYLGNGEYRIKTSYVKMRVEVGVEAKLQASFYGIVGVYFKVGLSAAGQLELKIDHFDAEDGFKFQQADITLENKLDLEGGVTLLWGAGTAGVYGAMTMGFTIAIIPETEVKTVYVTGDFGLRWSVLWGIYKGSYSFASGDIYRWPEEASTFMMRLYEVRRDPSNYQDNDRGYLDTRSDWLAPLEEGILQTSIYENVSPEIVTCGDTTMMVWLDDNAERDLDNFQALYYSILVDGVWSAPKQVDNNDTFDCEFAVYSDGSKIYIVYTEMTSRMNIDNLDISSAESVAELVTKVELNLVVYENGEFSTVKRITDNEICEQSPRIGKVNGRIAVLWLESNAMGIDEQEYDNSIVVSYLENGILGEAVTLVNSENSISDMAAIELDGLEYLAYIIDADGDDATIDDKTLVIRDIGGSAVMLDNGMISKLDRATVAGKSVLTWSNNGRVYMVNHRDATPVCLTDENSDASNGYEIIAIDDERSLLLFSDDNASEQGSDIYGIVFDDERALTKAIRYTEAEGYIASYAAYGANDEIYVVYNQTIATVTSDKVETSSNLCYTMLDFGVDIAITEIDFDIQNAINGIEAPVEITIENKGSVPINGVLVRLYDANGEIVSEDIVEIALASGEVNTINGYLSIPDEILKDDYQLMILPIIASTPADDKDERDNEYLVTLAYSDMSITAEQKIISDKNYILFTVVNEGNVASSGYLSVYAEDRLIASMQSDVIAPSATEQYLIDINALTSVEDKLLTCAVRADYYDPFTLNDKASVYLLHIDNDSLAVTPEDAVINPLLSDNVLYFDKYTDTSVSLTITAEAESFVSIDGLTKGIDYTVNYDEITINSSYLLSLDEGSTSLMLVFKKNGQDEVIRTLTLAISDTTPITLEGELAILGDAYIGETIYADLSSITPKDFGASYRFVIDGITVSTESSYQIKPEDDGKTIILQVTAGEGYIGSFEASVTASKKVGEMPNKPIVSSVEHDKITLVLVNGVEYSVDGINWQDENQFTGLAPNREYQIYARRRATETTLPSVMTEPVSVTTAKANVLPPEAPTLYGRTSESITLQTISGVEYSLDMVVWSESATFNGLTPDTEYRVYARYKETDSTYASAIVSESFKTKPVYVSGITLTESVTLYTGDSVQLEWNITPANATNQVVYLVSLDEAIATVNAYGEVTGVKEGYAYITITTADGSFTDTCAVTVTCSHASIVRVPEKESDCMNAGWDAYSVCDDCDRLFDSRENELDDIPYRELNDIHVGETELLNYSEPIHSTQTDGYTGDVKCLGCGDIIEYGHPITVDPHEEKDDWTTDGENHWKNCSICDTAIDSTIESHSEGEWVELDDGSYELRCDKCGELLETKPASVMLGDVNNDGIVNQYDYILIKRHYFETRILNDDEMVRADVNRDNKVDQYDYILVARHYFGTYEIK